MSDIETTFTSTYDIAVRRDLLKWAQTRQGSYVDSILQAQVPEAQRMKLLDAARTRESLMGMLGEDPGEASPKTEKPEKAQQPGITGAFWNGLKRGAYELGSAAAGVGAFYSHIRGNTELEKSRRQASDEYRAFAAEVPTVDSQAFLEHPAKVLSKLWLPEVVGHAIPSLAPFIVSGTLGPRLMLGAGTSLAMTPAVLGRLVWLGQRLGPGLTWGAEELGSMYTESLVQGKDAHEAARMALQAGAVGTALGAINLHSMVKTQGGLIKRAYKGAGLMEIYNFLSQGAKGLIRGDDIVSILKDTINGAPEAAVAGAGLGMALGERPPTKPSAAEGASKTPEATRQASPEIQVAREASQVDKARVEELARILADPKKPTEADRGQAAKLMLANPEAPMEDLVRLALGGITQAETVRSEEGGQPPPARGTAVAPAPAPEPEPRRAVHMESDGRETPGSLMPAADVSRETPSTQEMTIAPARTVVPGPAPMAGEPAPEKPATIEFQPDVGAPREVPQAQVRVEPADHIPGFANVPGGPDGPMARALRVLHQNEEYLAKIEAGKPIARHHGEYQWEANRLRAQGKITVWGLLTRPDVSFETPAHARAAVDLAEGAMEYADGVRKAALHAGMDEEAAAQTQILANDLIHKAHLGASMTGRTLESLKMVGEPAGSEAFLVTGGLPIAGPEAWAAKAQQIIETAGGPRGVLEQMEMLKTRAQRAGLGSLWMRAGQAYLENFMAWIFSPLTAAKVVASGFVTAGRDIALTGIAEKGVRPVKRLLNALAPEYVGAPATPVRATMNKVEALGAGLTQAWSAIGKMHDGLARQYKAEGLVRTEQQVQAILREAMPDYAEATRGWKWQPKIAAAQFPELEAVGTVGETVGRVLDVLGAVSRAPTLDILGTAHGFAFTMHDYMASYAKAAEIAEAAGLHGAARSAEINRLLQERPPEIAKAGMQNGKYQTFLPATEGEVRAWLQPFQNVWSRLFVAPVVGFPMRAALMAGETMPGIQHLIPKMRADWKAGGAAREMYLAKVALGWSLFVVGKALSDAGVLTGKRPKGVLGDVWDAEGKQEYSVNIGGKQFSYARAFEPLGLMMGTVANFAHAARELVEDHGFWNEALVVMASLGHTILDLPIMQGLSRWIEAMRSDDPNAMAKLLEQQVTPPPPMGGTLNIAAKTLDPIRREAHTWSERVLQRLPGWSDQLKPHRNIITGEPLLHEGMFGPGSSSFLATHTLVDSPALREIERLKGAGLQRVQDHLFGARPEQYIQREHPMPAGVKLTDAQRDRWTVLMTQEVKVGGKNLEQAMTALVTSAGYQRQSDSEKISRLHSVWSTYFLTARDRLLREDGELGQAAQTILGERAVARMPTERQPGARQRLQLLGR